MNCSLLAVHEFASFSVAVVNIANKIAFHFAVTGSFNFIHHFSKLYNISVVCGIAFIFLPYLCWKYENNNKEDTNNSIL